MARSKRRKKVKRAIPSNVTLRGNERPELDWSDPNILQLNTDGMLRDTTLFLVSMVERRKVLREVVSGDVPDAESRQVMEYLDSLIADAEENRDRIMKIQAMQTLFDAEHINPDTERTQHQRWPDSIRFVESDRPLDR